MNVVNLAHSAQLHEDIEVFEYLVFDKDKTVRIQTTKSQYFFATGFFYAATDLSRMLRGRQPVHCNYGIAKNRIIDIDKTLNRLCVDKQKILEALEADEVTSNYPGVAEFFQLFRRVHSEFTE